MKVPVEVSVITAQIRWWTGGSGSKRVTSEVKADTLQTHRTVASRGRLLGVNQLTLPCGCGKLPPRQFAFSGCDRFLVRQPDRAALQLQRGSGMASELLSDQKRVSRTGASPSELLILRCSIFLESKLMVSHPKVRLGLSDWKSWSAKPRFELVTPGADMAQAWGSCRDIGGVLQGHWGVLQGHWGLRHRCQTPLFSSPTPLAHVPPTAAQQLRSIGSSPLLSAL